MGESRRKSWRDHDDLHRLLVERGLEVEDEASTVAALRQIGYYRLSGYWRFFQKSPHYGDNDFVPGTRAEAVLDLYRLDARLRQLCSMAAAEVEVAMRTTFAHQVGRFMDAYGSYLNSSNYTPPPDDGKPVDELIRDDLQRAKHPFISRHRDSGFRDLPVWAAVEVLSFGTLSKAIDYGVDERVRKNVAATWNISQKGFSSTLRSIAVLRNSCAHHSRLWNTVPTYLPELAVKPAKAKRTWGQYETQSLMPVLIGLESFHVKVSDSWSFAAELRELMEEDATFAAGLRKPSIYWSAPLAPPV
ncbi:hypothetical protein HMPREF2863_10585 [Micrococcus sp. HMSC067E09]|uniref:Abi family protein n=2 Tax=Micrococcus TaxID=1269 RepID=UPI0008A1251B|nr:Abi family protein [Micrococcus sp. HMSC067E09]OFR88750.1 hypothetical protein HMPREF2863_10585 [Micrococcus sp. HMSC067E09]